MKQSLESKTISPLKELLVEELRDLLHAEGQLVKALPKMAKAAHHPKLKDAFTNHLSQTESHVERLKKVFELLGEKAQPKPCKAMMGLVEEGKETIEEGAEKENFTADLSLIVAAQKVEHYEISGYTSVRNLAHQLGEAAVVTLLEQTLNEERTADTMLGQLSMPLMQNEPGEAGKESRSFRTKAQTA